jgi:hypothetical protein
MDAFHEYQHTTESRRQMCLFPVMDPGNEYRHITERRRQLGRILFMNMSTALRGGDSCAVMDGGIMMVERPYILYTYIHNGWWKWCRNIMPSLSSSSLAVHRSAFLNAIFSSLLHKDLHCKYA